MRSPRSTRATSPWCNAKYEADDTLTETNGAHRHLGLEAAHNADGTVTYTQLKGDVVFEDVDFGYDEGKIVLHDINLYGQARARRSPSSALPAPARPPSPT